MALGFGTVGIADYIDDSGNLDGRFRTDYEEEDEGTSSNPLTIGSTCYYSNFSDPILIRVHASEACPDGPTVYEGGPFYWSNLTSQTSFWVVSGNVETSFSKQTLEDGSGNSIQGAPSLSTSLYGSPYLLNFFMLGIYFDDPPIGTPDKYEANLIIDNEGTGGPKFHPSFPFLSIGAQKDHGNSTRVGRMNAQYSPHRTTWKSTLRMVNYVQGDPPETGAHYVIGIAKWSGKRRMIQVALYHAGIAFSSSGTPGTHHHWNWTAGDSVWYPGADIAFVDAEDLTTHCGSAAGTVPRIVLTNTAYTYLLDWEGLFSCLSDEGLFDTAMPTNDPVDILGVHWAVEATGEASMWVSVSDMGMMQ